MHKLALVLVSLALAPPPAAGPSAADLATKMPLRNTPFVLQKQISPLLGAKQLAGMASKYVAKPEGPVLDQVVEVGVQRMVNGEVTLSFFCAGWVSGRDGGFAMWGRPTTRTCGSSIDGAVVEFPVQAGRVYVVNCSTNGGAWQLARWDGGNMIGTPERSKAASPSFAIAATQTKSEAVAVAVDWNEAGSGFSIAKCQVGRIAI
ncbi:MAG TPA: hypothetical protein VG755_37235 [Nannocystaceae bacterium]|nr:hypothetical protein [Nannocystaceae bacterium]